MRPRLARLNVQRIMMFLGLAILTAGPLASCGAEDGSPEFSAELPLVTVGLDGIFIGGDRLAEVLCVADNPSPSKPPGPAKRNCPDGFHLGVERFDKEAMNSDSLVISPLRKRLLIELEARSGIYGAVGEVEVGCNGHTVSPIPELPIRLAPEIPFRLVTEVIYTAGRVGDPRIGGISSFVLSSTWIGLPVWGIPFTLPRYSGATGSWNSSSPSLIVELFENSVALRVSTRGHPVGAAFFLDTGDQSRILGQSGADRIVVPMSRQGGFPAEGLEEAIAELLARRSEAWHSLVMFSAEDKVTWEEVERAANVLGISSNVEGCRDLWSMTKEGQFTCLIPLVL